MSEMKIMLNNLETLRKARGLTVDELMNQLGYTRNKYYQSWQKGKIKTADIIKLHKFFGVSTDCILDVKPISVKIEEGVQS